MLQIVEIDGYIYKLYICWCKRFWCGSGTEESAGLGRFEMPMKGPAFHLWFDSARQCSVQFSLLTIQEDDITISNVRHVSFSIILGQYWSCRWGCLPIPPSLCFPRTPWSAQTLIPLGLVVWRYAYLSWHARAIRRRVSRCCQLSLTWLISLCEWV